MIIIVGGELSCIVAWCGMAWHGVAAVRHDYGRRWGLSSALCNDKEAQAWKGGCVGDDGVQFGTLLSLYSVERTLLPLYSACIYSLACWSLASRVLLCLCWSLSHSSLTVCCTGVYFSPSHRRHSQSCSYHHYYALHCSLPRTSYSSVGKCVCNISVLHDWDGHVRLVGRSVCRSVCQSVCRSKHVFP